jgi:hypothetical protein
MFKPACDCTNQSNAPLCDPTNHNIQIRGKAYPGIRQLTVVDKLGDQGIVASICPRTLDRGSADYGYRPAVRAIVDRLKPAIEQQCPPQRLEQDPTASPPGSVPCLILETLGTPGDESICNNPAKGLSIPDPGVLEEFRKQEQAEFGSGSSADGMTDLSQYPVCQVAQIVVKGGDSCASSSDAGWCYVTGSAAGICSQAILFSPSGSPPSGTRIDLACIERAAAPTDNAR